MSVYHTEPSPFVWCSPGRCSGGSVFRAKVPTFLTGMSFGSSLWKMGLYPLHSPYIGVIYGRYPPPKKKVPEMAIDLWCLIIFINWDGRLGQVRAYLATEAWRCNMGDIVIWKKWQVPSSNQTLLDGKNPPLICDVSSSHYPLVI